MFPDRFFDSFIFFQKYGSTLEGTVLSRKYKPSLTPCGGLEIMLKERFEILEENLATCYHCDAVVNR